MNIIASLKNYFETKFKGDNTLNSPEGICPNCWGKQEWDNEYYTKIRVKNITSDDNIYNNFINEVAEKLGKVTLKEDILICETCKTSFK